ncbi:MAG: hypothetical protein FD177_320 [Desulfovibrionaceae bacterium]|nr:MAG: hypothetical protein FD177_320 [Desulfovibrionaceae bacterium]
MKFPVGASVLDFGCGAGIFSPEFTRRGFVYTGYDIDQDSLDYAGKLYRGSTFVNSTQALAGLGPFDCILSNCCFHHIGREDLKRVLLFLLSLLEDGGVFLCIDILAVPNDPSPLHRWFMTLEQGQHVRVESEQRDIIGEFFSIESSFVYRDVLFSMDWPGCPIGNDLLVLKCHK